MLNTIKQCSSGYRRHCCIIIFSSLLYFLHSQILTMGVICLFYSQALKYESLLPRNYKSLTRQFFFHISPFSDHFHSDIHNISPIIVHITFGFSVSADYKALYLPRLPKNNHTRAFNQYKCTMPRIDGGAQEKVGTKEINLGTSVCCGNCSRRLVKECGLCVKS